MSRRKHDKGYDGFDSDDVGPNKTDPAASENEFSEAILNTGFEAMKQEPARASELSVVRRQLEESSSRKGNNIMNTIQHKIKSHPRFSLVFVSAVAVLLFVVLVPFSYQKTVGYQVEYAIGDAGQVPTAEVLNSALAAIGHSEAKATFAYSGETGKCRISVLPNMHAVQETQALFASIMGTFSSPKVSPVVETISGSLYAQVKDKMVKIEIDATNKTDEEIQQEIKDKLAAQGFSCDIIYVKTDRNSLNSDSTKQIKFELSVKGDTGCLNSSGSGGDIIQIDGRGKTNDQVKAEIKARLAEKGMPNADVDVLGDRADSTNGTRIRIEIKDSTDN